MALSEFRAYQTYIANKKKNKICSYDPAYYLKNKEKRKAIAKRYYEKNKEKMLAQQRAYKAEKDRRLGKVKRVRADLSGWTRVEKQMRKNILQRAANRSKEDISAMRQRYYFNNREYLLAKSREYYWKDVEKSRARKRVNSLNRKITPAYKKRVLTDEQKAKRAAYRKKYNKKNRDRQRERCRAYYQKNKEVLYAKQCERRIKKLLITT